MNFKLLLFLMLPIAVIFIGCKQESQPTQNESDLEFQQLNKKPVSSELITFIGDLEGSEEVIGCCPNAGPFPEYTMTLSGPLPAGTYDGNIFMNVYGAGKNKSYIVQFWDETMFLEVIGGDIEKDNRTKTTTVMFNDEQCEVTMANVTTTFQVTFTLTRTQAQ